MMLNHHKIIEQEYPIFDLTYVEFSTRWSTLRLKFAHGLEQLILGIPPRIQMTWNHNKITLK